MTVLRLFRDGSRLEYGKGHADQWSVYLAWPHAAKALARESELLGRLEGLSTTCGAGALYDDYTVVYNRTTHEVRSYVFDLIHKLARVYGEQSLACEIALAMAYAGMVALERRHRSQPGAKRRQRLGVHLVLVEGRPVVTAAAFVRELPWAQVVAECAARGF